VSTPLATAEEVAASHSSMERELFSDAQVRITLDDATGVLRYTRSGVPFASLEAVRALSESTKRILTTLPARSLRVLIDVRAAPPRNDEAFEAESNKLVEAVLPTFTRHAVLVKTAAGRLQVARLAKERGRHTNAFSDEAEAIAFLSAP
jgi:hypothetical protein